MYKVSFFYLISIVDYTTHIDLLSPSKHDNQSHGIVYIY